MFSVLGCLVRSQAKTPLGGFLSSLTFAICEVGHRGMELEGANGGFIYVRVLELSA